MKTLIVGLGNPGKKYKNTRHNLGFLVIDRFQKKNNFPDFKTSKKFNALISKDKLNGYEIILGKPQTFMNNSGLSVKKLLSFFKPKELIVIHDDIDLPFGKIKIVKNRGSAGHKGIESIINVIKTKNFIRIRIGIQPKNEKIKNPSDFVTQVFKKEEKAKLKNILENATSAIETILKEGLARAMETYNKKFFLLTEISPRIK